MKKLTVIKKFQQGDLIIKETTEKQKGKKLTHCVLQSSDVSGHKHIIKKGNVSLYNHNNKDEFILVVVDKEVILTHEEHKPIKIPKGKYLVYGVKEFDPFEEEIRRVRD